MSEQLCSVLDQIVENAQLGDWQNVFRITSTALSSIENPKGSPITDKDLSKGSSEECGDFIDLLYWLEWCSARAAW
jgi:hypothetical protein